MILKKRIKTFVINELESLMTDLTLIIILIIENLDVRKVSFKYLRKYLRISLYLRISHYFSTQEFFFKPSNNKVFHFRN